MKKLWIQYIAMILSAGMVFAVFPLFSDRIALADADVEWQTDAYVNEFGDLVIPLPGGNSSTENHSSMPSSSDPDSSAESSSESSAEQTSSEDDVNSSEGFLDPTVSTIPLSSAASSAPSSSEVTSSEPPVSSDNLSSNTSSESSSAPSSSEVTSSEPPVSSDNPSSNASSENSSAPSSSEVTSSNPPVSSDNPSSNTSSATSSAPSSSETASSNPPVSSDNPSSSASSESSSAPSSSEVTSSEPPVSSDNPSSNTSSESSSAPSSSEVTSSEPPVSSDSPSSNTSSESSSAPSSSEVTSSEPPVSSEGSSSAPIVTDEKVFILENNQAVSYDISYILPRIVEAEIGGGSPVEAIKAQAVATHTFLRYYNDIQKRAPEVAQKTPTAAVKKACAEVINQIITVNGKLVYTPYCAATAGRTNSSEEVWGGKLSHLRSVESIYDNEDSTNWNRKTTMSVDTVREKLALMTGLSITGDPTTWLTCIDLTAGGYNKNMTICGNTTYKNAEGKTVTITGRAIREDILLEGKQKLLRSACFEWEVDGDNFIFTTKGYGHGVGLSQMGAIGYAKHGYSYDQILTHYYTGVQISVIS